MPVADRARMLALRPPRPPREELAPRDLGTKGGRPYERRLTLLLERAWPFLEEALIGARVALGASEEEGERWVKEVAAQLFEANAVERPADDPTRQWQAVEHRLHGLMSDRGLDLELACATLGIEPERVKARMAEDPLFAARLEIAFLRGTARLYGAIWDVAVKGGKDQIKAGLSLLQARDPRYAPVHRVEITEQQVMTSPHVQKILERIGRIFEGVVPEGSEDYRRGWADAVAEMRQKAAEELDRG